MFVPNEFTLCQKALTSATLATDDTIDCLCASQLETASLEQVVFSSHDALLWKGHSALPTTDAFLLLYLMKNKWRTYEFDIQLSKSSCPSILFSIH